MSQALRYPELSEDLKARGFSAMMRIFGPGAIIASVTIGSGETVFARAEGLFLVMRYSGVLLVAV